MHKIWGRVCPCCPSPVIRRVGLGIVIIANGIHLGALASGYDTPAQLLVFILSLAALPYLCASPPDTKTPSENNAKKPVPAEAPGKRSEEGEAKTSLPVYSVSAEESGKSSAGDVVEGLSHGRGPARLVWLPRHNPGPSSTELSPWLEALTFTLIAGVALFLRFYRWDTVPPALWSDELLAAANGTRILDGLSAPPFGTMPLIPYRPAWVHTFNLYSYYVAATLKLFGVGQFGIKMLSIVPGCATVLAFYWLVRELAGSRLAVIATAMLSLSRWQLVQSRYEWDATFAVAGAVLGLAAMARAIRTRQWGFMALGGICFGLTQYSYLASRLFAAGALAWLFVLLVGGWTHRQGFRRIAARGLAVWVLSFGVAAGPVVVHSILHRDIAESRIHELELDKLKEGGGKTSLAANTLVYLKMFGIKGPSHARQNIPNRPLLPYSLAILQAAGALLCLALWRRGPGHSLSWAVMVCTLATGVFSRSDGTPNAHRVGLAAPIAYFWAAYALDVAAVYFSRWLSWMSRRLQGRRAQIASRVHAVLLAGLLVTPIVIPGARDAYDYFVAYGQSKQLWRALPESRDIELARMFQRDKGTYTTWVDAAYNGLTLRLLLWRPPWVEHGQQRGGLEDPPLAWTRISPRRLLPEPDDMNVPLRVAIPPDRQALLAPLYPWTSWKTGHNRWDEVVVAVGLLQPEALLEARHELLTHALVSNGDFFLLPEDLDGSGLVRLVFSAQKTPGEWLEAYVDHPKKIKGLPEGHLGREETLMEWYGQLEISVPGKYGFEDPQKRRFTYLEIDETDLNLANGRQTIELSAGTHRFKLSARAARFRRITLKWQPPNEAWSPMPVDVLRPVIPGAFTEGNREER